ncbi:profilin, required for normal timing of actin polymerization in response to thermal stress [Thelotrema lepadinum]|nr:profilin, required for normal timing of actin polymerization in response to thermal stress [Thelotrema lepadinum]
MASGWDAWLPAFRKSCNDKVSIYGLDKAYDVPIIENDPRDLTGKTKLPHPKGPSPFASDYNCNPLAASSKKQHLTGLLYYGQLSTILDAFTDTSDVKKVQSEGFWVGDNRYVCLRSDEQRLYGKLGKEGGFLCFKWPLYHMLILCHYPTGIPDGNAVNELEGKIEESEEEYRKAQQAAKAAA